MLGKGCRTVTHEDYAAIAKSKGIIPVQDYAGSLKPILHKCLTCGHERLLAPGNVTRKATGYKKSFCPVCNGSKWTHARYVKELKVKHPTIVPVDKYVNAMTKILHRCNTCGDEWKTWPDTLLNGRGGCQQCGRSKNSTIAIEWLQSLEKKLRIKIQHAGNSREFVIPGTRLRVDGYNARKKIVFEFYGDVFHGNPKMFKRDAACHPFSDVTAGELYKKTKAKERQIRKLGYTLVTMWERDYRLQKQKEC